MILEIDWGNSFLKWRVLSDNLDFPPVVERAEAPSSLMAALVGLDIGHCRIASVRTHEETALLIEELQAALGARVSLATASAYLAGVHSGYEDPAKLGVDRWLALVAAYNDAARGCIVMDLGTAVTVDLVSDQGQHLGGYITPGLRLMESQLLASTGQVRFGSSAPAITPAPGRSTGDAVVRGCEKMLRAYLHTQLQDARQLLGDNAPVYVTGGDMSLVAGCFGFTAMPDLVFRGLAYACP